MWGVGFKGYPQWWWVGVLRRFWRTYPMEPLVLFCQMMLSVCERALHASRTL